jgi:hypothetical protein
MSTPTYEEALLAARQESLDVAVTEGRITPEQRAIAGDLLDGKIDQAEADKRFAALNPQP